jgi:hypothetical protein
MSKHSRRASDNVWYGLAQIFEELAPVAGPLCSNLGQVATIAHRVSTGQPRYRNAAAPQLLEAGEEEEQD